MKKTQNFNHPKKNAKIRVEPIRKIKDIKLIKGMLADNPRNLALFVLGINTNLRAGDMIAIKVGDIYKKSEIVLKEKKTGKIRRITLNTHVQEIIAGWITAGNLEMTDYLFKSQRGVLAVPSVSRLVKAWCRAINLNGNYGSHSLRKTFGYHQRVTYKVDIAILMETFNHSTQKQTLTYLGIQPEELKSVYMNIL